MIRLMQETDIAHADGILQRAHRVEVSFALQLRRNRGLTPECWWVMENEGRVVGVVGATDYGPFAHIGLMAIDPAAQLAGAGGELLQYALDQLEKRGFEAITLYSTDAGLGFYPRFGFVWAGLSTEWETRKRVARERRTKVRPARGVEEIVAWDRAVFGGERGGLLRALDAEMGERLLVAEDGAGRVIGFVYAQAVVIGPFAAETREVAGDLLDAALELEYRSKPRVLLPEAHFDGETLMVEMGFVPVRTSRWLVRGRAPVQQRGKMYGQGAYSLG
jgi:predicted N-acetyltransferase YhbS